jgi:hypothetical protein
MIEKAVKNTPAIADASQRQFFSGYTVGLSNVNNILRERVVVGCILTVCMRV